ncbi:MAG: extracellular solute-binding protein, partial [Holosporaceae bacterium]|nr:extracellular solute-binding protein [Holosporaceae bacterium]
MKFLLSTLTVFCFFNTYGYTLKITCRAKGIELVLLKEAIDEWKKETGNLCEVEIIALPHASNECFALYKQWLSAGSFDIDILQMDVAWIRVFFDYLVNLMEFYGSSEIDIKDYFDAVLNSMYDGDRLVALPLYTDCGIIYYRTDLMEKYGRTKPTTWQELFDTAKYIQDEEKKDPEKRNRFCGYVFQAKAYEILTCNFAEVVDSFGGAIVKDGVVVVNSDAVADAISFLMACLNKISSRSVLNYTEEDARGRFQSGQAVFMRNWPYA